MIMFATAYFACATNVSWAASFLHPITPLHAICNTTQLQVCLHEKQVSSHRNKTQRERHTHRYITRQPHNHFSFKGLIASHLHTGLAPCHRTRCARCCRLRRQARRSRDWRRRPWVRLWLKKKVLATGECACVCCCHNVVGLVGLVEVMMLVFKLVWLLSLLLLLLDCGC